MKYFYIFILLFAITTILAAEEKTIMMELKTKIKLAEDFRGGVEDALTEMGYSLVSEEDQIQTMKEQTKSDDGCIDDSCLVNVGKMLAVKGIVLIEIKEKSKKSYLFKAKYMDFETGATQKTKQDYFEYDLSNYKELSKFGNNLIKEMFGIKVVKEEVKVETKTEEVIVKDNNDIANVKIKEYINNHKKENN